MNRQQQNQHQRLFAHADDDNNNVDTFVKGTKTTAVITQLRPTKQDPGRLKVFTGRKIVATLSISIISAFALKCGTLWTDELASKINAASISDKAYQFALKVINRRALSSTELTYKLTAKGYSLEVARQVTDKMTATSCLDDEAYARAVIRQVTLAKPAGPRLLRQKLMAKKLDHELIDRLLEEYANNSDNHAGEIDEKLTKLVQSRLSRMSTLDINTKRRRLYSLLARRGFYPEQISNVLNKMIPDEPDTD